MSTTKTQRSNCRFVVQQSPDGKPLIMVQLYQSTIPALEKATVGFDLLGGTRVEHARNVADLLNEHVLDLFVTLTEHTTG
jgi:hypothetical protein